MSSPLRPALSESAKCPRPVSSPLFRTNFQIKPFDDDVEGLSRCDFETCIFECEVQADDFENDALFRDIRFKPLFFKALREFKYLYRRIGDLRFLL